MTRIAAAVAPFAVPDLDRRPAACRPDAVSVVHRLPVSVRLALAAEDAVDLDMAVGQFAPGAVELDLQPLPGP